MSCASWLPDQPGIIAREEGSLRKEGAFFYGHLCGLSATANLWVYVVANLLGGAVAAAVFRFISPEDHVAVAAA